MARDFGRETESMGRNCNKNRGEVAPVDRNMEENAASSEPDMISHEKRRQQPKVPLSYEKGYEKNYKRKKEKMYGHELNL